MEIEDMPNERVIKIMAEKVGCSPEAMAEYFYGNGNPSWSEWCAKYGKDPSKNYFEPNP